MSKHKLELIEYLKVRNVWEFEFDLGDQVAWDQLVSLATAFDDVSPLENPLYDFPKKAPNDPVKWYELAQLIYSGTKPFKCISANEPIALDDGEADISTGYRLLSPNGDVFEDDENEDFF